MPNILITSAGGAGIADLAESLIPEHVVYLVDAKAETVNLPPLPFRQVPIASDSSYESTLSALIKEWNIDYVVPGHDAELIPVRKLCDTIGVRCISPTLAFTKTCLYKKILMEVLDEKGISHLPSFTSIDDVSYPAFAKPIQGSGSKQAHRIDTLEQMQGYLSLYNVDFNDILVQPLAMGQEYTVSVIVNNLNKVIGIVPKCVHEKRGLTMHATSEENQVIEQSCMEIVENMRPCGPFNVQLIIQDKNCCIFEINPRLSSTALLTEKAFGSEISLYIRYFDVERIDSTPNLKTGLEFQRSFMQKVT